MVVAGDHVLRAEVHERTDGPSLQILQEQGVLAEHPMSADDVGQQHERKHQARDGRDLTVSNSHHDGDAPLHALSIRCRDHDSSLPLIPLMAAVACGVDRLAGAEERLHVPGLDRLERHPGRIHERS